MSSKFSNDLANNMSSILKDSNFQRIFSKTASTKKTASGDFFGIKELELNYPEAFNALKEADKIKFQNFLFHLNDAGKIIAKSQDIGSTDEYVFLNSQNRAPVWFKTATNESLEESAFNSFASKKKKDDEEDKSDKDDKDDKDEKKSDKKSKKDKDEDEDKEKDDEKKSSKKSKKDEDDEDDDKKKDKKKSFPFFKKKKAGVNSEKCECGKDECDCGDQMYASALKHIVESFTVTSDVLDNMGLEKSAVATMAILNHIIEEAANVKFAKESEEHTLEKKIKELKEKFKDMHRKVDNYDADAAEELDDRITKLEEKLKDLKKKDLSKSDKNDVRGTDLLLGLEDNDALESFLDPELDDPKSSAVLEDILTKNPKLVDEIVPGLKSQFNDKEIEDQLKSRIKTRLPEIVHTSDEDSDIESLLQPKSRELTPSILDEVYNIHNNKVEIPQSPKLPTEFEKNKPIPFKKEYIHDPLKTKIDELNSDDISLACNLVDSFLKKANNSDFGLDELEERFPEAYEALPEPYKNDSKALTFFIDENNNLCAEGDLVVGGVYMFTNDLNGHGEWIKIEESFGYDVVDKNSFEDESDARDKIIFDDDIKSIIDVLEPFSENELNEKIKSPKTLNDLSKEFYIKTKKDIK